MLNRVLYSSTVFPVEYGFIPQTWYHYNDPLDIMVLSYEPLEVGCIVKVRPIGVLILEDEEGEDPKTLSVPMRDPRFNGVKDVGDIYLHRLAEIREFFEVYKRLELENGLNLNLGKTQMKPKLVIYAINLYKTTFEHKI